MLSDRRFVLPVLSWMLAFAVLIGTSTVVPASAQTPDTTATPATNASAVPPTPIVQGDGTVVLTDWPRSLTRLLREMGRRAPRLLPELDSLVVDYAYEARASDVAWSFDLRWVPGTRLLDRGDVKPWTQAPPDTRMVSVELLADVFVNGKKETEMIVAVDSMALRPAPDTYGFDASVSYERVFLDTEPERAKRYLRQDVTLANLRVERMGFASFATGDASVHTPDDRPDDDPRTGEPDVRERRTPPAPSVYQPRVGILIGWRIGPDPYYIGGRRDDVDPRRTQRPRGDTVGGTPGDDRGQGRTADRTSGDRDSDDTRTGRTDDGDAQADARSGGRPKKGDRDSKDDDRDDEDLLVPALAAAAAVGVFAYAGGTVGLYGTGDTPLGLTAGYTHPTGGVHLQAAINPAVIDDQGTQRLTAKVLGFYDVFASRIQPALGLGVQAEARDETRIEPSVSVGLAATTGRFVFYGGFDVAQQTPEIGLAFNFRGGVGTSDDEIASRR